MSNDNKYVNKKLIESNGKGILISNEDKTYIIPSLYYLIWEECDGKKDVNQIAEKLSLEINEKIGLKLSNGYVEKIVAKILEDLAKNDLILLNT
ncbi:MAG: PqqD family peptide modification chaperone [Nitrososphaerota archaeon]